MTSYIEELFRGNLAPLEQMRPTEKGLALRKKLCKGEEALFRTISEEEKKIYQSLIDLLVDMGTLESIQSFTYGFRAGSRLMLEVMEDKEP